MSREQAHGQQHGLRTCDLCGCKVAGGEEQWRIHTQGIKHRRNQASCRLLGTPGHAVVSVFEAGWEEQRQQQQQLPEQQQATAAAAAAAAAQGGARARGGGASASSSSSRVPAQRAAAEQQDQERQQQLAALQRRVTGELAALVGVGSGTYRPASQAFTLPALASAHQRLSAAVAAAEQQAAAAQPPPRRRPWSHRRPCGNLLEGAPEGDREGQPEGAALPSLLDLLQQQLPLGHQWQQVGVGREDARQQQQQQQQQEEGEWDQEKQEEEAGPALWLDVVVEAPADAAVLGLLLPGIAAPPGPVELRLQVPYQTFGPAAAAMAAAMASLAASLAPLRQLRGLVVHWRCRDYLDLLRQSAGAAFGPRTSQLWGGFVAALAGAMRVNASLARISLAAFPNQLPPDDLAALQVAAASARPRLRANLLLCVNAAAAAAAAAAGGEAAAAAGGRGAAAGGGGVASLLVRLPQELLAKVLDMAVPRRACQLMLVLPRDMLDGIGPSSSDGDDDGDSDETSTSSDETSTSSDDTSSSESESDGSSSSSSSSSDGSSSESESDSKSDSSSSASDGSSSASDGGSSDKEDDSSGGSDG